MVSGELPVKKIYENDNFLSIPDIHPKVEGHCLVMPKKHFETFLDMPPTLGSELIDAVKGTSLRMMKEKRATGFNLVNNNFETAGQVVKHVHFHILPRKKGDGFEVLV
jgi:histidine triad (HIT) family protein